MIEEWKSIKNYEGLYMISNLGRVRSHIFKNTKLLKKSITNNYEAISLSKNGLKKRFSVHRLVGIHFIKNPYNKEQINHKDGIKTNNIYTNLEWNTKSENQIHAYKTGLQIKNKMFSDEIVSQIRFEKLNTTYDNLLKKYDCSKRTLSNIILKKSPYDK